jgi:hypothetical protein
VPKQVVHADLIPTLVGLRIFQAMPASVRAKSIFAACRGQGAQSEQHTHFSLTSLPLLVHVEPCSCEPAHAGVSSAPSSRASRQPQWP